MIPESEIERAVDWLRDNAPEAAQAKANAIYLRKWVDTVKAKCANKHIGLSQVAAESKALEDPDYLAALQALKEAIEKDSNFEFLREAASAKISAWQTQNANARAEGRAYGNG